MYDPKGILFRESSIGIIAIVSKITWTFEICINKVFDFENSFKVLVSKEYLLCITNAQIFVNSKIALLFWRES